jgi:hypothetical protein
MILRRNTRITVLNQIGPHSHAQCRGRPTAEDLGESSTTFRSGKAGARSPELQQPDGMLFKSVLL